MSFSRTDMNIDVELETERIVQSIKQVAYRKLRRYGGVIGISGGIDSSVCLALSVRAFGANKVVGIAMPEVDSNPDSEVLARDLAEQYGVEFIVEDMTPSLAGFGTYQRRDEAIKRVFPEFTREHKAKIVLPSALCGRDAKFELHARPRHEPPARRVPFHREHSRSDRA